MAKFFIYEMPEAGRKTIKPIELQQIQDLMAGLVTVSLGKSNIDNFVGCNAFGILPGGEEQNEAFRNMEFISKLVKAEEFKPLMLPTNEEINKAKILKLVYDHLEYQHSMGQATTLHGIHTTVEQLMKAMQDEVSKTRDIGLADAVFNLNLANNDLVTSQFPSLFSNTTPWERRISPIVLELKVGKFFRDQYPKGYVISDVEEFSRLADKFLQVNPIGVPKDTLEEVFFKVCPCS